MRFEWDDDKERINVIKRGVDFSTAALVFDDGHCLEMYDEAHSVDEDRFIAIGNIAGRITVLMVVFTERGDAIRIISARKATNREEEMYYAGIQRD